MRKICKELKKKEDGEKRWKSVEKRLIELKIDKEELKANVAILSEEHKRMKIVTDCFKTLFSGLAM